MRYETLPPPASLSAYVRFFWIMEGGGTREQPFVYRSMADGCTELLFHYRGCFDELTAKGSLPSFNSGIHGQSGKSRRFSIAGSFGIFGAYLYPFALPALFGLPASLVSDEMVSLDALLGIEGRDLEAQMITAAGNRQRLQHIVRFLEARVSRRKPDGADHMPALIRSLQKGCTPCRVAQLAGEQFLSVRQFERQFKQASGFSPKKYLRILRFQEALRTAGSGRSLTEVAYACGYADQSHFIYDFKAFSGHHPGFFFKGKCTDTTALVLP
ncbi:helix-turn-helix domain-containing protein [Taibaiella koreensis]|uniref:helix-turn-helix domain-containing protein n=1 Tax=Taibaiella koreensis TaxID=1268548 RepID=UPI000E59E9A0|nr:helix-turn-helix domain-containing protein [Taibaiella koreensis]